MGSSRVNNKVGVNKDSKINSSKDRDKANNKVSKVKDRDNNKVSKVEDKGKDSKVKDRGKDNNKVSKAEDRDNNKVNKDKGKVRDKVNKDKGKVRDKVNKDKGKVRDKGNNKVKVAVVKPVDAIRAAVRDRMVNASRVRPINKGCRWWAAGECRAVVNAAKSVVKRRLSYVNVCAKPKSCVAA